MRGRETEIREAWREHYADDGIRWNGDKIADYFLALQAKELEEIRDIIEEGKKNLVVKTDGHCNPRCHDQGRESAIDDILYLLDGLIEKP
jgi:hypothetical protein